MGNEHVKKMKGRVKAIKKGYREWEKQRRLAEPYGQHHVNEIDAIFSRELARLEGYRDGKV
jgi:hypothetical protein